MTGRKTTIQWKKSLLTACLLLSPLAELGLAAPPAWADSSALTSLENHFFQHTYATDTDEERLSRIEKLVFGEAKSGDQASRLTEVQKVISDAEPSGSNSSSSSNSSNSDSSSGSSSRSPSGRNTAGGATGADDATSTSAADNADYASTDYPRVDELEQLIFNQRYKQMPLAKRLNQLEIKAFGKPSQDDDLSARTDRLEQYWEKTLSPSLERQYLSTVEWLESKVIGQNYRSKPLIERVQTLEGIVFANQPPDTSSGIKEQLDTLTHAVQLTKGTAPGVTAMETDADSGRSTNYQGHTYPGSGQLAQSQYTSQQQYGSGQQTGQSSTGFQMPSQANSQGIGQGQAPESFGSIQGFQPQSNYASQPAYQPTQSQDYSQAGQASESSTAGGGEQKRQSNGHPLLRGLAKALGAAATMAAGAMSSSMMYGGGYGNGYGNSLYNSGGYGGYGNYGGYGGYGNGYGGYNGGYNNYNYNNRGFGLHF